jgi:hypothetical protein
MSTDLHDFIDDLECGSFAERHDLDLPSVLRVARELRRLEAPASVRSPEPQWIVRPDDITVARKEVFGDWTSGITGPTNEDFKVADLINQRLRKRSGDPGVAVAPPPPEPLTVTPREQVECDLCSGVGGQGVVVRDPRPGHHFTCAEFCLHCWPRLINAQQ